MANPKEKGRFSGKERGKSRRGSCFLKRVSQLMRGMGGGRKETKKRWERKGGNKLNERRVAAVEQKREELRKHASDARAGG